jgi:hypothetical protein
MWKWVYLILIGGSVALSGAILLLLGILLAAGAHIEDEWPIFVVLAMLPVPVGSIAMLVLMYKMWAAIQDGQARTTPEKAILFLLIPFFNIYWLFQVFWGWAKDYNAYVARHELAGAPRMPEGMFLGYVVLIFLSALVLPAVILYFVMLYMIWKICDGVNALPAAPAAGAPTPTPTPA